MHSRPTMRRCRCLCELPPAMQALKDAGIEIGSEAFEKLDKTRSGVMIGSGMGGLTVFQDGVKNLVEKGYKKITPFFIPYAITNMCGSVSFLSTLSGAV